MASGVRVPKQQERLLESSSRSLSTLHRTLLGIHTFRERAARRGEPTRNPCPCSPIIPGTLVFGSTLGGRVTNLQLGVEAVHGDGSTLSHLPLREEVT